MNQWLTLLQGALAGGAIGAIISPYISQRSDRRTARANAREKLAEAENARRDPTAALPEILIQLRTAAMIAGAPQLVVEKYISVSQNYQTLGFDQNTRKSARLDRSRPQNWCGFLNMDAVMAASILSSVLWHPWLGRVLVGLRMRFKLWIWQRRLRLIAIRSALLHYTEKGGDPFPFDDDSVVLLSYCYEHLPRYLRNGIPVRSRIKQRFTHGKPTDMPAAPDAKSLRGAASGRAA
jgi:hypothetical protein